MVAALGWAWRVLVWLLLLAVGAILALAVVVPRVAGATPYTILTGSMRPHMPPGTLVVVRPTPVSQVKVGRVVTYQLTSGEPTVVTHRVVAQAFDGAGHELFQTKGDANPTPDPAWVRPVQIKGARWYAVPYLGYVSELLTGHQRQIGVYAVAGGCFLYAGVLFLGAMRDRRRAAASGQHREVAGISHG